MLVKKSGGWGDISNLLEVHEPTWHTGDGCAKRVFSAGGWSDWEVKGVHMLGVVDKFLLVTVL